MDAAAGWAQTENAACARKTAVMAELFNRRTGLPAGERELWWVDPQAAVGAELGAAQNVSAWMALAQAHRGVVLADRLPKVAALFAAGLIGEPLVRAIEYRTALVTDAEAIARVDALLAEHVTGWGPLSIKKTEQGIDTIVDQVDPGALRRSRTAAYQRDVQFGSPSDEAGFTVTAPPEPRCTPSRALADFVRCRDLTCRWPGCDKPAYGCDLDHTVPYPIGPTHASNIKCYCCFHPRAQVLSS